MKKSFTLVFFFILYNSVLFSQTDLSRDIVAAANEGYTAYLQKIPPGKETLFGFKNRDEFAIAKIGKPYQIFQLTKQFFTDTILTDENYVVPSGEWRVAIVTENENRVMVTVAKMEGNWKVVGIGAAGLASELESFEKLTNESGQGGKILRVLPLDCEFVFYTEDPLLKSAKLHFLKSANIAFDQSTNEQSAFSLKQLLVTIKEKIGNK